MVVEVALSGSYRETAPLVKSLWSRASGSHFCFDAFYRRCAAIRNDRRVSTVLVVRSPTFRTPAVAALEEIREELAGLVAAGKQVAFFSSEYRDAELFLASVCSRRILHPLGSLRCVGLARTDIFLKRLIDRLGVNVRIVRRGKYKSAMDRFRLDAMDAANLEQYRTWLDACANRLHDGIRTGYGPDAPDLARLLDGTVLDANGALREGWVDETTSLDAVRAAWREAKLRRRRVRVPRSIGRGPRIAVLHFEGAIVEGASRSDPLLGQALGSAEYVSHIDRLRRDRRTRAVVLRIGSGGGSAVASEEIRNALVRLAQEKPLVVSMGVVAGSGGYWIALTGAPIYALETTLTGSIGVITVAADVGHALSRIGVTHDTIRTHEHADAAAGFRPLTEKEMNELDRQVGFIYDSFVSLVADRRNLDRESVLESGSGRVWSGRAAAERGLVDGVGGLNEAIGEARRRAGLRRAKIVFRPRLSFTLLERILYGTTDGGRTTAALELPTAGDLSRAAIRRALLQLAPAPSVRLVSALASLCGRPLLIDPSTLLHPDRLDALDADLESE